jgi:hypothetical protein
LRFIGPSEEVEWRRARMQVFTDVVLEADAAAAVAVVVVVVVVSVALIAGASRGRE